MKKSILFSCLIILALLSCNSKNDAESKKEPVSDLTGLVSFQEKEVSFVDHSVQNISVKLNLDNNIVKSDANNTEYQLNLVDVNGVKVTNLHVNPEKLVLSKSDNIKDFQISSDNAPLDGELHLSLVRSGKQVLQADAIKYHVKNVPENLMGIVLFKAKEVRFTDHVVNNISMQLNLNNPIVKSDADSVEYKINLVNKDGSKVNVLHVEPAILTLSKATNIKDFQISSDNAPLDGDLYVSLERDGKQVMQSDFLRYYVTRSDSGSDIEINKDNINTKYKAGAWLDENGMFIFDTSTGLTGPASFISDSSDIYFELVSNKNKIDEKHIEKKFISSVLVGNAIKDTTFKTDGVCPKGWVEEYDQQQVFSTSADGKIKIIGIICQETANPNNQILYSYFLNNGILGKLDIDNTPVAGGPINYQGVSNNGKYLMYSNLAIDDEFRGEDTMFNVLATKSIIMHNPDGSRFLQNSGILSLSDNGNVLAYRWKDKSDQKKGLTFMLCSASNGTCKDIIYSESDDYSAATMSDDGKFIYLITEVNKVKKLLVLDENAKVIKENPFDLNQFKANYGYFYLTAHNSGVLELEYFEKVDENNDRRVIKFYSYSANKLVSLVDVVKALKLTRTPEKDNFLKVSIDISPNEMYVLALFSETEDPGYDDTPLVAINRVFVKNGIDSVISGIKVSKS